MLSRTMLNIALKGVALCALVVGLNSCGGGGSGGQQAASNPWSPGVFNPADQYENWCAVPRQGTDLSTGKKYPDRQGSTLDENNFLRSWSNDTYLWYSEIVDQDPAEFASTLAYFATLKTSAETLSGRAKDNFHFTYKTAVWDGLINSGIDTGYGISWAWLPGAPLVSYTEPGSPAANGNLQRGAKLLKVDGVDFSYNNNIDVMNKGLFPSAHGEVHTFEVLDLGATESRTLQLTSGPITKVPVQNVKIIPTDSGNVGYFLFNDHLATAEQGLIDVIAQFKQANITDLVLDVRYNGGGYLYIASELAYMIAGGSATRNKTFERITFNDKHTELGLQGESLQPMGFYNKSSSGGDLPVLNLPRIFIITSGNTCSASESVINGLRGVNVEVIQIGAQTCGKPYGFYARDNCATTYFTIQFKGVNNKGFGEYADGFIPSANDNGLDNVKGCESGDDFTHLLGDTAELNLASALHYRVQGQCPARSTGVGLQKLSGESYSNVRATLNKEPGLSNRIMR